MSYILNSAETKLHNVRKEPFFSSPVVGHLLSDKEILAMAECADWLKVKYHRAYESGEGGDEKKEGDDYGWCLKRSESRTYLLAVSEEGYAEMDEEIEENVPARAETPYASEVGDETFEEGANEEGEDDSEDEQWYELRDDDGELYYFNSGTGVSQWEPPRWFAEVDPVSGLKYYVNTSTGDPQWNMPDDFVPCVREECYSTPEAEFVKSMLSPKRSRYGENMFKEDANIDV